LIKFGLKASKIDFVLISHLHGDHYFGLIGLLSSMHLNGRIKPIHIFAPYALQEILALQFKHSDTQLRYELIYHVIDSEKPEVIFENSDIVIQTIILNHRIP
jgi:ribonuclease Z